MKTTLLLLITLLLAPVTALGVPPDDWVDCGGEDTVPTSQNRLRHIDGHICFLFDDSWSTTAVFYIETSRASCNLVQDQLASGGTATLDIHACPTGNSIRTTTTCPEIIKSFATNDSVSITRGVYLIVNTATAGSGDEAVFSCRAYK